MSLANTLLNGGMYGVSIDASKYTHSNGATRIAMESIEELHEIFMESFYNPEQAVLAAATEGVALEGSQYESVMEASISGAFNKIKDFLKKLLEKVKAFFHSVKRYIDSIFMSGAEFAKKYEKDIRDAGTLKDFEFKMYEYDDAKISGFANGVSTDVGTLVDKIINEVDKPIESELSSGDNFSSSIKGDIIDTEYSDTDAGKAELAKDNKAYGGKTLEYYKKQYDHDAVAKRAVEAISDGAGGTKCSDPDDFDEWLFGHFRKGATNSEDKTDVEIKSVRELASTLISDKKLGTTVDKLQSTSDKAFKKAIKVVDDTEKRYNRIDAKNSNNITEILRLMSSAISVSQSYVNKALTAWKTAIKDRDSDYKSAIVAGLRHADKQKKKK